MSFLNFCQKCKLKKGKLALREKRTAVITYPKKLGDQMSQQYHLYCKYFLLKHKPWHGNVNNDWVGPVTDPEKYEYALYLEDDNNSLVNGWYVDQFHAF